jgi:diguanylate cyclase (GGDEF)-like protein
MTKTKWLKPVLLLTVMGAAIAGGVYGVNRTSVDTQLESLASRSVLALAKRLGNNMPDTAELSEQGVVSDAAKKFIADAVEAGGLLRIKLFSAEGKLMYDTRMSDMNSAELTEAERNLGTHNAKAFAAVASADPFTKIETKEQGGQSLLISESYVPLMKDGKTVGVIEVYLDQTENAQQFRQGFTWSTLLSTLMALAGFAVPAAGYYYRSQQKLKADENVHFLANHDTLTELPNRTHFLTKFAEGLNTSSDKKHFAMLHFVDLDFFKEINDRFGHDFGDEVLRVVSGRLKSTLRQGDIAARFGGDEFVVAQFDFENHEQLASAARRLVKAFKDPLQVQDKEVQLTASIGSAVSNLAGAQPEEMLKNADTAVYVVKSRGRNGHCFFEDKFDEEKRKRIELELLVRKNVAEKSFELHYQPMINVAQSAIKGFEALLRMKDQAGNPVSPMHFVPVAEEIGLIDEIGAWVLETACKTAATWPEEIQISVNLSPAQFRRRSIVPVTRQALASSGIAPSRLLLEITESLLLNDTDAVLEQLRELKALGISIVMDDFGTGYSSLGYMLKFPFDRIKIDRSFVREMDNGNDSATTLVQTIIALGHTLKMNVTAEGVETEQQASILRGMKCDDAQGYLFGRPIPATDIPALLMKEFAREKLSDSTERQEQIRA